MTQRRIAIIGGGMSGLGAAWALAQHPDRFDFRLFEANDRLGGNAFTADMPQDDGTSIPFDISVTALIPSVYDHVLLLLDRFGIELFDTKFNYSVKYQGRRYAHDFDSDIRDQLQARDRAFPAPAATPALVRPPHPGTVEAPQRAQPVQLHQHEDSAESRRVLC